MFFSTPPNHVLPTMDTLAEYRFKMPQALAKLMQKYKLGYQTEIH